MEFCFETEFSTNQGIASVMIYADREYTWPNKRLVYGVIQQGQLKLKDLLHVSKSEIHSNEISDEFAAELISDFLEIRIHTGCKPGYGSFGHFVMRQEIISRRKYNGKPYYELPYGHPLKMMLQETPYGRGVGGYHVPYTALEKQYLQYLNDPALRDFHPEEYGMPTPERVEDERWIREIMYRKMQKEYSRGSNYSGDQLNKELLNIEMLDESQMLRYVGNIMQIFESKKSFFGRLFG